MRTRKHIALLLAVCLLMTMVVGCNQSTEAPKEEPQPQTITFTDSAGRNIELPATINRIAPSGQLAQIVLFAIAPDMFVGITNKWSASAEKFLNTEYYNLPVLGQFYGAQNLNLEEIAKVNPQVIIDIGESKTTIVEDMDGITNQIHIPTIHIEATTATMPQAYRTLGKLLNREKEAEVLAQYCEQTYTKTQDIMRAVGDDKKVKLLYLSGDDGLNVIAKGSFHAEILDMISNNVAVIENPSSKGTGNPVDMEQIVLWNPEVIIFAPGSVYSQVGSDPAWQNLAAIKSGKYYEVPEGPFNWMGFPPSVNRYMGMIWVTQLLYPDQAQYNAFEETKKYYDLFYHTQLTEDQYNGLVANSLLKK